MVIFREKHPKTFMRAIDYQAGSPEGRKILEFIPTRNCRPPMKKNSVLGN